MDAPAPGGADAGRFARLPLRGLLLWPLGGLAALAAVSAVHRIPPSMSAIALFTVVYAALLVAIVRSCRAAGLTLRDLWGAAPSTRDIWLRAMMSVPLLVAAALLSGWFILFLASKVAPAMMDAWLARRQHGTYELLTSSTRVPLLVFICVVAPLVEEMVFRGVLLRRLTASRPFWTSLLLSGFAFAILHPQFLFGAWVIGIVLGVLYLSSGSLLVPAVVHMTYNAVVAIGVLSEGKAQAAADTSATTLTEMTAAWPSMVVLAILVGVSIAVLVRPLLPPARARAAAA